MPSLFVYFNAPGGRPRSLRQWIRIVKSRPHVALSHFTRWTIGLLTRCEFADVSVGDEHWTIELNPRGDRVFPAEHFFLNYPNLAWCVVVELRTNSGRSDELRTMADPHRRWTKLTMPLSWLTGGRWPSHDCVQKARSLLLAYGISSPTMASPSDLWDWLRSEGYEFIPLKDREYGREETPRLPPDSA